MHCDASLLGKITDAVPIADTIIQITEPSSTSLVARELSLSNFEMGHLPIPDYWSLIWLGEEQNDQGYDSDG